MYRITPAVHATGPVRSVIKFVVSGKEATRACTSPITETSAGWRGAVAAKIHWASWILEVPFDFAVPLLRMLSRTHPPSASNSTPTTSRGTLELMRRPSRPSNHSYSFSHLETHALGSTSQSA